MGLITKNSRGVGMAESFTVGNFNVRNLGPPSTADASHFFYGMRAHNRYWAEGEGRENTYRRKTDWLAHQLDLMNADIVCFEEVFDRLPLEDVLAKTRSAKGAKLYVSGESVREKGRYDGVESWVHKVPRLALMVGEDFEVVKFKSLESFPSTFDFSRQVVEDSGRRWKIDLLESGQSLQKFARPLMKARIRLPSHFSGVSGVPKGSQPEITVFAAHLKSKRPIRVKTQGNNPRQATIRYLRENALGDTRALVLRGLEAAALRAYVLDELERYPYRPVMIIADLNDGPRSVTTQVAGGLQQPVIHGGIERDWDAREKMSEAVADLSLYSAYDLQTQRTHRDVYYTHIFDGFHDTLDHILVSSHFVPKWQRGGRGSKNIGKVGTLRVFNDHLIGPDVDDLKSQSVGKYLHTRSDHGQVTVRLDWF